VVTRAAAPLRARTSSAPGWRKPGAGMLLVACHTLGVDPEEAIFVGDSPADEDAAQAAGIRFVWAKEFFWRNNYAQNDFHLR